MTVGKFVSRETIHPIYFDTSYYLVPDGEAGQDVYVVLRDAIEKSGQAALTRVVISRRERAVAILPLDRGLVVHTLNEPRDLYDHAKLFEQIPNTRPDAEMVKLATQLIERQEAKFEPADTEDRYEARLREVIDAKLKGEGITPEEPESPRGDNVIDLMAALKRSLGQGRKAARDEAAPQQQRGKSVPQKRKAAAHRTVAKKKSAPRKRA